MDKRELYELIEAYLDGSLPDRQRQEVERRMATDADFREEVELHRALQEDYEDPSRWRLREALSGIMDEPPPPEAPAPENERPRPRRSLWAALPVVLLLAGGIWYFMKPEAPATTPVAPIEKQPEKTPAEQEKKAPPPDVPAQKPEKTMPIAQADPADFNENPGMDRLIGELRGAAELRVKMTVPEVGARLRQKPFTKTELHFSGTVEGAAKAEKLSLVLLVFDNKNSNAPLLRLPLLLEADTEGRANFSVTRQVDFRRGLYYYRIEEQESEDWLVVGKFFIGKL